MNNKGTDFPQFRKLSNGKVFYRINSDRHFDEIQIMGSKANMFSMEAKQYPEILRIQDLLSMEMDGFEESNQEEFDNLLNNYSLG